MSRHKGRRVPPPMSPWTQVGRTNAPVEEMAQALTSDGGLFMLAFFHAPFCPAGRTQREADCICTPEYQLLRYEDT